MGAQARFLPSLLAAGKLVVGRRALILTASLLACGTSWKLAVTLQNISIGDLIEQEMINHLDFRSST